MSRFRAFPCLLLLVSSLPAQEPVKTIEGIVRAVGDSGMPLAGADVRIGARSATSNAQGRFRIDSVPFGFNPVVIRAIGYQPVRSRIEVYHNSQSFWEFFLPRSPYRLPDVAVEARRTGIYGVVTDRFQQPLARARVEVIGNRGGNVVTDSTGRFAFPDAVVGAYMLRVTRPDYVERRLMFEVERGKGMELSVSLSAGSGRRVTHAEAQALFDLRRSLAFGLKRERLAGEELARYGSLSVCDIPRVRLVAGTNQVGILNGERRMGPGEMCSWNADEVAMIQFIVMSAGLTSRRSRGPPSVIIWEKW